MSLSKIDKQLHIPWKTPEGVFAPTGTTKALVEAVCSYVTKPGKLLDLGCGSGVIGFELYQRGIVTPPLYASDISEKAIECLEMNARENNYFSITKCGSLFEPWEGEQFDYIVDDVAGISREVALISTWYKDVPCESGDGGTLLINQIIRQANQHLKPNGLFFFPVISLSNILDILTTARSHFKQLTKLSHTEWPLPKEMYARVDLLKRLQGEGHIDFVEKFGMILYFTDVYVGHQ